MSDFKRDFQANPATLLIQGSCAVAAAAVRNAAASSNESAAPPPSKEETTILAQGYLRTARGLAFAATES